MIWIYSKHYLSIMPLINLESKGIKEMIDEKQYLKFLCGFERW